MKNTKKRADYQKKFLEDLTIFSNCCMLLGQFTIYTKEVLCHVV